MGLGAFRGGAGSVFICSPYPAARLCKDGCPH